MGRVPIRFVTFDIRNGRNRGLELVLRGMSQANMDLGIFQETKLTNVVYICESSINSVVATNALSQHYGRVAVFYTFSTHFAVEAVQTFGPNVVGFQMATGEQGWYIVGYYLSPIDTSTIDSVVAALKE